VDKYFCLLKKGVYRRNYLIGEMIFNKKNEVTELLFDPRIFYQECGINDGRTWSVVLKKEIKVELPGRQAEKKYKK